MAQIERRANGLRQALKCLQYVLRTLVGELLRKVMVVQTEGQLRGGAAFIDALQHLRRRVAGDVVGAEQPGEANGQFDFGVIVNRRGVIGNAADTGLVEQRARRAEERVAGMRQQHELAARHFDLFDPQASQLRDHRLHRKGVIAIRANADTQGHPRAGGPRRRARTPAPA